MYFICFEVFYQAGCNFKVETWCYKNYQKYSCDNGSSLLTNYMSLQHISIKQCLFYKQLFYILCVVVVQPALGYHITNSQSRYVTPTRLKSAQYSLHNNAPSSRKLLKMDVLMSETCWAVNWHNKASVIRLVYLYSNHSIILQWISNKNTTILCIQIN